MSLQDLIFLREVDMSSNELTTLPIFWTNMASLVNLSLGDHLFKVGVGKLTQLQKILYMQWYPFSS